MDYFKVEALYVYMITTNEKPREDFEYVAGRAANGNEPRPPITEIEPHESVNLMLGALDRLAVQTICRELKYAKSVNIQLNDGREFSLPHRDFNGPDLADHVWLTIINACKGEERQELVEAYDHYQENRHKDIFAVPDKPPPRAPFVLPEEYRMGG